MQIGLTFSSLLVGLACVASAQGPLIDHTFKTNDGGWTAVGQDAKLAITHDAAVALPEAGALKYEYEIKTGSFSSLYLPVTLGSLAKAKSVKLRVRSDAISVVAVILSEQDGGRYVATCFAPKDSWQTIELATADFILGRDENDPKDPDGKLDMDKVSSVTVFDVSQFFAQAGADNPVLKSLFNVRYGTHTMYMDSFQVGTESIPVSTSSVGSDVTLDSFVHPQLQWFGLGGMVVSKASSAPNSGVGIKAAYHASAGQPAILTRSVAPWVMVGAKTLTFDVSATHETTLIVQFEQTDGGKYNMTTVVPAGTDLKHVKLSLAGFQRGDDSKDSGTKINLGLIKTLSFIDVSAMTTKMDVDNTLWIGKIHALGE